MPKIRLILSLIIIFSLPLILRSEILFKSVINISADSTSYSLLVDKYKQEMYILKSCEPCSLDVIKKFRITTGKVIGNKEKEGDNKTPEGIYFIIGEYSDDELPEKYGPLAFILDYPNRVDRIFDKTGSDIWIHGRNEEIVGYQTEGCISLENSRILDLAPYIEIGKTPVIIMDSLTVVNSTAYKKYAEMWKSLLQTWSKSWENGDTSTYFQCYSPLFKDDNHLKFQRFKENKKRLEKRYPWKSITVENLVILTSEHESLLEFTQSYCCPNFYSHGIKTLTFIPNDTSWKIVHEKFKSTVPRIAIKESLQRFINLWKTEWEDRKIEKYIAFYDSSFSNGDYKFEEWYKYKKNIFDNTSKITLGLSDFRFNNTGKIEWEVSFLQFYQSDRYEDAGQKTLLIRGYPPNYKIFNERWVPVKTNVKN